MIRMSADVSAAIVTKLGTCFFEDGRAGETGVEVILNGDDTKLIGATASCCCGIEGAASDIGAGKTLSVVESDSYCNPGGLFSDLEQIGSGMVNELLSASEIKSSCMNLDGGCDADEWGLGIFNEVLSSSVGLT